MYSASRIWKAPCQELMGSRTVHGQRRYTRACPRSWTNPLQTHLSIRELVAVVDAQCCTRSTTIHNIAYPVPHARASERRVVRLPPGRTYLLEFNGDLSNSLLCLRHATQAVKPLETGTGTHSAESLSAHMAYDTKNLPTPDEATLATNCRTRT